MRTQESHRVDEAKARREVQRGELVALAAVAVAVWTRLSAPPTDVPVISMSALSRRALRNAATDLGIFRLTHHGVDIEAVLNASKTFFALPEDVKRSARSGSGASGGVKHKHLASRFPRVFRAPICAARWPPRLPASHPAPA